MAEAEGGRDGLVFLRCLWLAGQAVEVCEHCLGNGCLAAGDKKDPTGCARAGTGRKG